MYVLSSAAVLATEDKTSAAKVEFWLFADVVIILSSTKPTVDASDLFITLANSLESPALLPALIITFSINLFTWVCSEDWKVEPFSKLLSLTDDNIWRDRLEFLLLFPPCKADWSSYILILSTIILIVSAFDLLITFANIIVFSSLLPAAATASSINLLTCVCSLACK